MTDLDDYAALVFRAASAVVDDEGQVVVGEGQVVVDEDQVVVDEGRVVVDEDQVAVSGGVRVVVGNCVRRVLEVNVGCLGQHQK